MHWKNKKNKKDKHIFAPAQRNCNQFSNHRLGVINSEKLIRNPIGLELFVLYTEQSLWYKASKSDKASGRIISPIRSFVPHVMKMTYELWQIWAGAILEHVLATSKNGINNAVRGGLKGNFSSVKQARINKGKIKTSSMGVQV